MNKDKYNQYIRATSQVAKTQEVKSIKDIKKENVKQSMSQIRPQTPTNAPVKKNSKPLKFI